jgi:hypothetical protein
MTSQAQAKLIDAYGHPSDYYAFTTSGYPVLASAASGTAVGTVVNPGTADPTGTQTAFLGGDMYGQFTVTTAGTQTTGAFRTINFNNPLPALRPVAIAIFTAAGVLSGGVITYTLTTSGIAISIGTALVTATAYTVTWQVL